MKEMKIIVRLAMLIPSAPYPTSRAVYCSCKNLDLKEQQLESCRNAMMLLNTTQL